MDNVTEQKPYWWIKKVEDSLFQKDEKPLLRMPEPFDWEEFSHKLTQVLGVDDIQIFPHQIEWLAKEELEESMTGDTSTYSVSLSPITEPVFWTLDKGQIKKLTSRLLLKEKTSHSISSEMLQEGYYNFLLLQVLNSINEKKTFEEFSLKLTEETGFSNDTDILCVDVKITIAEENLFGKILITPDFRKSWNKHFSQAPSISKNALMKNVEVLLSLEVGHTALSSFQYNEIAKGDFVLLDRCKIDPKTHQGTVTLKLGDVPLFQAKIKQNRIQLMDLANYHEDTSMNEEEFSEKELPKDLSNDSPAETSFEPTMDEPVEIESEEPSSLGTSPIALTVEVAKIKMTLEKLLELQPGNFLELPVHPEQGVNLTVNGKKVGRAELVHLGEALGIRILELEG